MKKTLTIILTIHFFAIFLLSAIKFTLPSDMLENLLWGRTLSFESDKHPPFFGWEAFLIVKLFGGNLLFYHIITPLHQVLMLACTFFLANKILKNQKLALIAVIFTQAIIINTFYYKFNANTANFGIFSLTYLIFYKIIKEESYKLFPILGFLCGVIMLIKYSGVILISLLGLTVLASKEGRKSLKSPFFFLGILAFLLVIIPYLKNMIEAENYGAFKYLTEQSILKKYTWLEIPKFIFLPIVFCIPFLIGFFSLKPKFKKKAFNFDSKFLILNVAGPFVLTFTYMILALAKVGTFWLSMFYSLIPLLFLYFFKTENNLQKVLKIVYPILFVIYIIYFLIAFFNPEEDSAAIGQFTQNVIEENENPSYFLCNDARRNCGTVLIYGTDYANVKMPVSKWKDSFAEFAKLKEKPKKLIIIGNEKEIKLEGYSLKFYQQSFPRYFKFGVEKLNSYFPKILQKEIAKLQQPVIINLVVATYDNKNE